MLAHKLAVLPPLLLGIIISHVAAEALFPITAPLASPAKSLLEHTPVQPSEAHCTKLRLTGPIETTQCDYETIESVQDELYNRLHELVTTPFFRYYKVDLYRDCPFWQDDGLCMQRECGVTSIDESEVPERWRAAALSRVQKESPDDALRLPGCYSRAHDYCFLDDGEEGEYVDLAVNQEGYTGYAGDKAHNIWRSIYEENCFGMQETHSAHAEDLVVPSRFDQTPSSTVGLEAEKNTEECLEKRVYYKIISGLHASISTHICQLDLNKTTGEWGPNLDCFTTRIAEHPERLQYIYFNTVLLLRAVARVGPYLSAYNLDDSTDVPQSNALLTSVLDIAKSVGQFDEKTLFAGSDAKILKEEFKDAFRNVSRIMDCVGCDKCRLWGKVQITGVAAAMKILFEMDEKALDPQLNQNLLSRWEVVALINVLHRFTESIHAAEDFRRMYRERGLAAAHREESAKAPVPASSPKQIQKAGARAAHSSQAASPSPSSTSVPIANTSAALAELQNLGKTVLSACKRSTLGCFSALERLVRRLFPGLTSDSSKQAQAQSGEL